MKVSDMQMTCYEMKVNEMNEWNEMTWQWKWNGNDMKLNETTWT